jgi:hypothetical protein
VVISKLDEHLTLILLLYNGYIFTCSSFFKFSFDLKYIFFYFSISGFKKIKSHHILVKGKNLRLTLIITMKKIGFSINMFHSTLIITMKKISFSINMFHSMREVLLKYYLAITLPERLDLDLKSFLNLN